MCQGVEWGSRLVVCAVLIMMGASSLCAAPKSADCLVLQKLSNASQVLPPIPAFNGQHRRSGELLTGGHRIERGSRELSNLADGTYFYLVVNPTAVPGFEVVLWSQEIPEPIQAEIARSGKIPENFFVKHRSLLRALSIESGVSLDGLRLNSVVGAGEVIVLNGQVREVNDLAGTFRRSTAAHLGNNGHRGSVQVLKEHGLPIQETFEETRGQVIERGSHVLARVPDGIYYYHIVRPQGEPPGGEVLLWDIQLPVRIQVQMRNGVPPEAFFDKDLSVRRLVSSQTGVALTLERYGQYAGGGRVLISNGRIGEINDIAGSIQLAGDRNGPSNPAPSESLQRIVQLLHESGLRFPGDDIETAAIADLPARSTRFTLRMRRGTDILPHSEVAKRHKHDRDVIRYNTMADNLKDPERREIRRLLAELHKSVYEVLPSGNPVGTVDLVDWDGACRLYARERRFPTVLALNEVGPILERINDESLDFAVLRIEDVREARLALRVAQYVLPAARQVAALRQLHSRLIKLFPQRDSAGVMDAAQMYLFIRDRDLGDVDLYFVPHLGELRKAVQTLEEGNDAGTALIGALDGRPDDVNYPKHSVELLKRFDFLVKHLEKLKNSP